MELIKPADESRPNVVTAVGHGWRVFVAGEELSVGESVLMGVDRYVTNASVTGYNYVTERVRVPGGSTWITLSEFEEGLTEGQFIRTIPTMVKVQARSYWGEVVSVHATGGISFNGITRSY
jgi:hypothetical protein